MKSFIKGMLSLSVLLILAGLFTMLPSFVQRLKKEEKASSQIEMASSESIMGENSSNLTTLSDYTFDSGPVSTIYNNLEVYVISSAIDLAKVAYNVNSGIGNYASANYYLACDIDLQASGWTPIGTSSNPFTGNFLGNDKTISNIHIGNLNLDTNSNSGVGLFGNVVGGTISDLAVDGSFSVMIDENRNVGALVGSISDGELLNVYDLTDKKIEVNGVSVTSKNSVGLTSNTLYFKGSNNDFDYTSNSSGTTTGTLTGITATGNVGIYRIKGSGKFYLADPKKQTEWTENAVLRVALTTGDGDYSESIDNPIYSSHKPMLRNAIVGISGVGATNKYVYPLLAGSKPTIGDLTSRKVGMITFATKTEDVYLGFNYGSRSGTYTIPYDTSFNELDSQYITRAGYTLATINGKTLAAMGRIYNIGYPTYPPYSTETDVNPNQYTWKAREDNLFNITFLKGEDDNGNEWTLPNPSIKKVSGATESQNGYTHTSGTTVMITFELSANFFVSGVGKVTTETGLHPSYNPSNATDDSYLPATISEPHTGGDNTAKYYTIEIENIVGNGGDFYIYIERAKQTINVQLKGLDYGSESSINYTVDLWSNTTENFNDDNKLNSDPVTVRPGATSNISFKVRVGQDMYLKLSTGAYILNISASNINGTIGEAKGKQEQTIGPYHIAEKTGNDCTFMITIGQLSAKVRTYLYDEDDTTLSNAIALDSGSISINGTEVGIESDSFVGINLANESIQVSLGNNEQSIYGDIAEVQICEENGVAINDSGLYNPYTGEAENPANGFYIIKIRLERKIHTFSNEDIRFKDGDSDATYTLGSDFVSTFFGVSVNVDGTSIEAGTEYGYGETLSISITLTGAGKSMIYLPESGLTSFFNNETGSLDMGTLSQSYSNGSWAIEIQTSLVKPQIVVTFYFKQITINFDGALDTSYQTIELADNDYSPSITSLTGKYQFNDGDTSNTTLSTTDFFIDLSTKYYLVSWYLQNGELYHIIEGGFGDYIHASNYTVWTQENSQIFEFSIKAVVGERVLNVTYMPGGANDAYNEYVLANGVTGSLQGGIDGGSLSYNMPYGLLTEGASFHNFGHTLSGWSLSGQGSVTGSVNNWKLIITGENWSSYFGGGTGTSQSWSSFAHDNSIGASTSKSADLTLTAEWTEIAYGAKIDETTSAVTIKIGDTITFTSGGPGENGTYTITPRETETSYDSNSQIGHIAVSFDINLDGIGLDGQTTLILTVANLKEILSTNYYYKVNDSDNKILITTNFEAAVYKLYIEHSKHYHVAYDVDAIIGNNLGGFEDADSDGIYDEGEEVYINVTFGQVASNLSTALQNDYITITRFGYDFSGFKVGNDSFGPEYIYDTPNDTTLTPVFTKTAGATASAEIAFDGEEVGDKTEFYLLNSINIANGTVSYKGGSESYSENRLTVGTILPNGEEITGFGFRIYKDGATIYTELSTDGKKALNLFDFVVEELLAGEYEVSFFVTVTDSLNTTSTETTYEGSRIAFTILENEIVLNSDNTIVSVFSNSSTFVPAQTTAGYAKDNTFGTFRLKYNWDGTETVDNAQEIQLADFANTDSVSISGDFPVGGGRNITLTVTGNIESINNINVSEISAWSQVFRNTSDTTLTLNGVCEIVKAIFTIDFGDASSYYFGSDGSTIVKEYNGSDLGFTIGETNFSYNYSKIVYIGADTSGTFTVSLTDIDHLSKFRVDGITITGFETNWSDSFEYRLNGTFELLSTNGTIRQSYSTRYITATNGVLDNELKENIVGLSATVTISNIRYQGTNISDVAGGAIYGNYDEHGFYGESITFKVNNVTIFSFTGNNTGELLLYVNQDANDISSLRFSITSTITGADSDKFKLLSDWNDTATVRDYESNFDVDYENNGFSELGITNTSTTSQTDYYAVFSNVRKVTINYDGGRNSKNAGSETVYISAGQTYTVTDPTHPYTGLSFNGYQRSGATDPTLTDGEGNITLTVVSGGGPTTLTAMWRLSSILVDPEENREISFFANPTAGTSINLSQFIDIDSLSIINMTSGTFAFVFKITKDGGTTFTFKPSELTEIASGSFTLEDAGTTPASLSGSYTLTISLTYVDDTSGESKVEGQEVATYSITVNENIINFAEEFYYEATYNNQGHDFAVALTKNGERFETNPSYSKVNSDATTYGITLTATRTLDGQGNGVTEIATTGLIRIAGTYTVSASIASGMDEYFALGDIDEFTATISRYAFDINSYVGEGDQLGATPIFSKNLGGNDPSMTKSLTINNESVELDFKRDSGESAGFYDITANITNTDDQNNYKLTVSTIEYGFEITVPGEVLYIQMNSALTYVYNGERLALSVSFDSDTESFTLSGRAGDKTISTAISLFYYSGGQQVQIPADEGENYANLLSSSLSIANNRADAGTYDISINSASLQALGWGDVAFTDDSENQVIITQRPIVVTGFIATFNGTTTFTFANVTSESTNFGFNTEGETGIVGGDSVTITVTVSDCHAGSRTITNITLDPESDRNYEISWNEGLQATINPSAETVTMSPESKEIDYGIIKNATTLQELLEAVTVSFTGQSLGEKANNFITVSKFAINNPSYSTGRYLNAGRWTLSLTVASSDFTFGQDDTDEDGNYTTTFDLTLTVKPIALTITNKADKSVTKPYDGNNTVLSDFVGHNVGEDDSYFEATGLETDDIITVTSATYSSREIGTWDLSFVYSETDDHQNYAITIEAKGRITSVTLRFIKDYNHTFVDDKQEVENTVAITVDYEGGDDGTRGINALIEVICNPSNFVIRRGYTQTGWKWKGLDLNTSMSQTDKDDFLQAAVDAGTNGLTLQVVWQIKTFTVTFSLPANGTITLDHANYTLGNSHIITIENVAYWTTISGITATASEGYIVSDITASNSDNVTLQTSNVSTKNASFDLNNIIDAVTITLTSAEMEFKITLQTNEPQGFTANIDSASGGLTGGWTRNGNTFTRVVDYTQARSDLPKLIMTVSNTYDFNGWLLGDKASTGTNIWERIGGSGLNQSDTTTGFTFTATWTESELTLTFDNIENGSITVTADGETVTGTADPDDGSRAIYTVHYNDRIEISVTAFAWYKFTDATISGDNENITISGRGQTIGSIVIDPLLEEKTIAIAIAPIEITFNVHSKEDTLFGTEVTNNTIKGTMFTIETLSATLDFASGIGLFSATAGTYRQTGWTYSGEEIGFGDDIKTFITNHGGIPTQDTPYDIYATWQGEKYTVTFLKGEPLPNADDSTPTPTFTSPGDSGDRATRVWIYGSIIENMPELEASGQEYYWALEANPAVTFANGNRFTLAEPDSVSPYELTLEAQWAHDHYTITINFAGSTDKISSLTVDGEEVSISGNVATVTNVVYGDSKDLILSLMTGYMVDSENTRITNDGHIEGSDPATLSFREDDVTVKGVHGNIELTITVKAKSYKILVPNQNEHVTASINEFTVSYDEDITAIFDNVSFTRGGYTISALYDGNTLFASFIDDDWQFEDEYVVITDNNSDGKNEYIYQTDRGLTLDMVWTVDSENPYFSSSIAVGNNLYYNGSAQKVATGSFTASETLVKDATLNNLDWVIAIYYVIGDLETGTSIDYTGSDYGLYYKDAIKTTIWLVVELQDTLSKSGSTYTITSQAKLTVNASEVNISGAVIESYYTGTAEIVPSNGDDYSEGDLYYHDGTTPITELTIDIDHVELVPGTDAADPDPYKVGTGYQVKYYFTKGTDFNLDNFTGLKEEGGYITFTPDTSMVSANVVPSIITLNISGKAFESGEKQQITSFEATMPEHAIEFTIAIASIYTNSDRSGTYGDISRLNIDYSITRGEADVAKTNFEIVVSGSYQIVPASDGYEIVLSSGELIFTDGAPSLTVRSDIAYNFTAFAYNDTISGGSISGDITGSEFSYLDASGNLIFSVSGNNFTSPLVQVVNGINISFTISITCDDKVLLWQVGDINADGARATLETLASEEATTKEFALSQSSNQISLVVTSYKAILLNLGDKDGGGKNQGYVYIEIGQSQPVYLAEGNDWEGFTFTGWSSQSTEISISDNTTIFVEGNASIIAGEVMAVWEIDTPEGTQTATQIERDAKPAVGAQIDAIDFAHIVSAITNENNLINYSYSWLRAGGESAYNEKDGFTVDANTTSSGSYTVTVTASYTGSVSGRNYSASRSFSFELQINTIDIGDVTITGGEAGESGEIVFTYANYDYIDALSVSFARDDIADANLRDIFGETDERTYYFILSAGSTATDCIKDAGEYTLELFLDSTVFTTSTVTQVVSIKKYDLTISQSDLPSFLKSKVFGSSDPVFDFEHNVSFTKTSTKEVVNISLKREGGESAGVYDFTDISIAQSNNYNISMQDLTFTITAFDGGTLVITIDNSLSRVYDKTVPTFAFSFGSTDKKWYLSVAGGNSSTVSLNIEATEGVTPPTLNEILYSLALENITISALNTVVNAGNYTNTSFILTAGTGANFTNLRLVINFTIEQREITVREDSVTKVFDRSDVITTATSFAFDNIIEADRDFVTLNGNFAGSVAGEHSLENLSITGDMANNYLLVEDDYFGTITPLSVTDISIAIGKTEFKYGDINSGMSLDEVLSLVLSIETTIDGVSGDVANEFVSVSDWSVSTDICSSAGFIDAGEQTITFTITSTNFSFTGGVTTDGTSSTTCDVSINISQLDLDLSAIEIIKNYDMTTSMPPDFSGNINEYILSYNNVYDDVAIDVDASSYDTKEVGKGKTVYIVLTGDDIDNYNLLPYTNGVIREFSITFNVVADQEHPSLVTDGSFVEDGLSPIVRTSSFTFVYPSSLTGEGIMLQITLPTRDGYMATGWMIASADGYSVLNRDTVLGVLQSVAFDPSNLTKEINIYTVWEIRYYDITINLSNATYELAGDYVNTEEGTARYFSDISIAVTANRGYKYMGAVITGTYGSRNLGTTGYSTGTIGISQVKSALTVTVSIVNINITIRINPNTPDYTSLERNQSFSITTPYASLSSLDFDDLPQLTVTEGTYYLSDFSYTTADGERQNLGRQTLQAMIDAILPDFSTDATVSISAEWTGYTYVVTFDGNFGNEDGELTGTNPLTVVYGSAFAEELPTAYLPGRSNTWQDEYGVTYSGGDIYHTIGTYSEENARWEATIYAIWENNTYTLTIEFDERIQISINNRPIISGSTYPMTYSETVLTFSITSDRGYDFMANTTNLNGEWDGERCTVYNLTADGTLIINSTPAPNQLSYTTSYIDSVSISINDGIAVNGDLPNGSVTVYTESVATLTFTPVKGYELNTDSVTLTNGTSGMIEASIDEEGRLVVVWRGFTTDESISVSPIASINDLTYDDISSIISSITFNGVSYSPSGGTVQVRTQTTGESLVVRAELRYGYYNGFEGDDPKDILSITTSGEVVSQTCTFDPSSRCYILEATITNIDEDIELSFVAEPREYTFVVATIDELLGSVDDAISTQTVKFGGPLSLSATANTGYVFAGWQWNDELFDFNAETEYTISIADMNRLESATDGINYIYATFTEEASLVTISLSGNGAVGISQGDEEYIISRNTTAIANVYVALPLTIRFIPQDGYEVDRVTVDGVDINLEEHSYDIDQNTITLILDVNDPIERINISFKASEANIIVRTSVMVNYNQTYGTTLGGRVLLSDAQGNLLSESLYLENDGRLVIGADYRYLSYTSNSVYFMVEVNEGYNYTFAARGMQEGGNYGSVEINGRIVYFVNGVIDLTTVTVTFTATENEIRVYFVSGSDHQLMQGGAIFADTSSPLVQVNNNGSSSILAHVITGGELSLTINAGIAFSLLRDNNGLLRYDIQSSTDYQITAGLVTDLDIIQTGYSNTASLTLTGVAGGATIYIYVQPKTYNLTFYVDRNTQVTIENLLTYGQPINLNILTQEQRDIIFPTREGYTLGGYYTSQYGRGVQYIDRFHEAVRPWAENGYYYTGTEYAVDTSIFDPETQTFTIFAAWELNKSHITISFIPEGFENDSDLAGIQDIIVSISPDEIPWFDSNNKWYADVSAGVRVTLRAYEFEGYEFKYWLITKDGQSLGTQGSRFELTFEQGNYLIEAVYHPLFTIAVNDEQAGSSILMQNGQQVVSASFDPNQTVTLVATPNYGYNFLYWQVDGSDERIEGTFDQASGSYIYTYPELLQTELHVTAVFEGKTIIVNFTTEELLADNELSVRLDGEEIDYSQPFSAVVGQTVTIRILKPLGYTFEIIGIEPALSQEQVYSQTYYIYTYTIDFHDVIDEQSAQINVLLRGIAEEVHLTFSYQVEDDDDGSERALIGNLYYIDASGRMTEITDTSNQFVFLYGQSVTFASSTSSYYQITDIKLFNGQFDTNLNHLFIDGRLEITESLIRNIYNSELTINITISRVLWIDQDTRILQGEGSADNPYIISSEEEMAYVAYLVNEGIVNEQGEKYSECVYELTADLDFSGKYWVPIGTHENPFNGTMRLGEFTISNIVHYTSYNPETSYGGLFWILGDDARITQSNNTLVIVLSIIGGIILLLLLILLIILLIRKKKKEELEKIANS